MVGKAAEGRCTLGSGPVVSEVLGRIGDRTRSEQYTVCVFVYIICVCAYVCTCVFTQERHTCICVCVHLQIIRFGAVSPLLCQKGGTFCSTPFALSAACMQGEHTANMAQDTMAKSSWTHFS